jgi:hypothetical protein
MEMPQFANRLGGIPVSAQNRRRMARDMASILIRNSVNGHRSEEPACSRCRRVPLVGEWLYQLGSGARVCSLCVARAAPREGEPVNAERVRSSERRLAVVRPRAA